jgi:hypothetical protein
MVDNNTLEDWQLAILVECRRFDDPSIVEANEAKEYHAHTDLIDDAKPIDNPVVIERSEADRLDEADALLEAASGIDDWVLVPTATRTDEEEAVDAVTDFLSEVLQDQHDLREGTVARMDALAMVNQFRDDEDSEIELESLTQQPETGGSPSADEVTAADPGDEGDGDGEDDIEAAHESLSADERTEVRELYDRAELMRDRTPEYAATLEQEAVSIVGVDEYDDIDMEAL